MKKILNVLQGEAVTSPPIWLMRQAGRYMPEYQEIRSQYDFLTMCRTPELATEITLQPVRRFGMDGAILFSDILIILPPMGIDVRFEEGRGPVVQPLRTMEQLHDLEILRPHHDIPFVLEALASVKNHLPADCTMIGFSGAPFTLASYAIEGGTSRNFITTMEWLYRERETFTRVMNAFTEAVMAYTEAQAEAGAEVIQLFDTWAGILPSHLYREIVLPSIQAVVSRLQPHVPVIYYILNGAHLLPELKQIESAGLSVDWRLPLADVRKSLDSARPLQGNLDPTILFASQSAIAEETDRILHEMKGMPHIFNLGHGVIVGTPVENVAFLVNHVHAH